MKTEACIPELSLLLQFAPAPNLIIYAKLCTWIPLHSFGYRSRHTYIQFFTCTFFSFFSLQIKIMMQHFAELI